jgi:hypothetical protein
MARGETYDQSLAVCSVLYGRRFERSVCMMIICEFGWCEFARGIFRLIGFEELGHDDAFDTATLELRLSMCGEQLSPISA